MNRLFRVRIFSLVVTAFIIYLTPIISSQEIEIAQFVLDDNKIMSERLDASKELLWRVAPETGKILFLIDKFEDNILYVEQSNIDSQEHKIINTSNPDSSIRVNISFKHPENAEVIKLTSDYIISCEVIEPILSDDGANYYKYSVKVFSLADETESEILSGTCSTPLFVLSIYRDSKSVFIVEEDVNVEAKTADLFIKVFDTQLNLQSEFNKNEESLQDLKYRERWFSRNAILDNDNFSKITLAFSNDDVPTFRQYRYDRQNEQFNEIACPDGFEIYDHKV